MRESTIAEQDHVRHSTASSPEGVAHAFVAAWNSHSAEAIASLFAKDADFINVVGLWWEDRKSIRAAHDYGFRRIFGNSHMSVDRVKVRQMEQGVAVVVWSWSLSGQEATQDQSAGSRRGLFTFVVVESDGDWMVVSAHNTDCVPGSETNMNRGGSLQPETYQRPRTQRPGEPR